MSHDALLYSPSVIAATVAQAQVAALHPPRSHHSLKTLHVRIQHSIASIPCECRLGVRLPCCLRATVNQLLE